MPGAMIPLASTHSGNSSARRTGLPCAIDRLNPASTCNSSRPALPGTGGGCLGGAVEVEVDAGVGLLHDAEGAYAVDGFERVGDAIGRQAPALRQHVF